MGVAGDMTNRCFSVRAVWDDDAKVFYAQSDILGLHVEAATLDEFEEIVMDTAPDLIVANHLTTMPDGDPPSRRPRLPS